MGTRNVTTEDYDPRSRFGLYRLCDCPTCGGSGKDPERSGPPKYGSVSCSDCRGEGRIRQLVAECESPEAIGVALVTLGREKEWEGCAFGLLDRMPPCERCGGDGQEPFDSYQSQNPYVRVSCNICNGSGFKPTGDWIILPWLPSARNVTDAARTLAKSKKRSTSS